MNDRAKLRLKTLLVGVASFYGVSASLPAHAIVLGPCPFPVPAPCITWDVGRLTQQAQSIGLQVQRVKTGFDEIERWKENAKNLGPNALATFGTKFGFDASSGLANGNMFGGLSGVNGFTPYDAGTDIVTTKNQFNDDLFAGVDATAEQLNQTQKRRAAATRAAAIDAVALTYGTPSSVAESLAAADRIQNAMDESLDLRTDWSVNSEVRREVDLAMAKQNYLWQAYLQVRSVQAVKNSPADGPKDHIPFSAVAVAAPSGVSASKWTNVTQIRKLTAEAQGLLQMLGAVKSGASVSSMGQSVVDDYTDTLSRQSVMTAQLTAKAKQWAANAGKPTMWPVIVNTVNSRLATQDSQMAFLRDQPVQNLTSQFNQRNMDTDELLAADVDPRQFLGTWSDPAKYDMNETMTKNLYDGALDPYISGGGDEKDFVKTVYDYNDVRLEAAWKNDLMSQMGPIMAENDQTLQDIQQFSPTALNDAAVTARLQEIVAEANALGADLTGATDPGITEAAALALNQLAAAVGVGTDLPDVDDPLP